MNSTLYAGNSQELGIPERKNVQDKQTIRREVENTRLAWLAGIIDGEGSIKLSDTKNNKGQRSIQKWVCVENTDVQMIAEISRIYSLLGVQYHYQLNLRKDKLRQGKKANASLVISVNSYQGIKTVLEAVDPYLITKRKQAQKIVEFIDWRMTLPFKSGPTDKPFWSYPKTQVLIDELRALKIPAIDPSTITRAASTPLEMKI